MKEYRVTVEVDRGAIYCRDKGGNLHGAPEDEITWAGTPAFKLVFADLDTGADDVWPFKQNRPSWPVTKFTGTLKSAGARVNYKYSVKIAGYRDLDPIIIVDE